MSTEYIRLTRPEIRYAGKNFLESQIHTISLIGHYKAYRKLRDEELILRVALKNKIHELQKIFLVIDKMLPRLPHEPKSVKNAPMKIDVVKSPLEQELDEIRRKLSELN